MTSRTTVLWCKVVSWRRRAVSWRPRAVNWRCRAVSWRRRAVSWRRTAVSWYRNAICGVLCGCRDVGWWGRGVGRAAVVRQTWHWRRMPVSIGACTLISSFSHVLVISWNSLCLPTQWWVSNSIYIHRLCRENKQTINTLLLHEYICSHT